MCVASFISVVLRKKKEKGKEKYPGLLLLSSRDQDGILVELCFLTQRPFTQRLVAQQTRLFWKKYRQQRVLLPVPSFQWHWMQKGCSLTVVLPSLNELCQLGFGCFPSRSQPFSPAVIVGHRQIKQLLSGWLDLQNGPSLLCQSCRARRPILGLCFLPPCCQKSRMKPLLMIWPAECDTQLGCPPCEVPQHLWNSTVPIGTSILPWLAGWRKQECKKGHKYWMKNTAAVTPHFISENSCLFPVWSEQYESKDWHACMPWCW